VLTLSAYLIFSIFSSINYAHGADYYFSSSQGSDSRSELQAQSPSQPWKSIKKLNEIAGSLRAGDRVLFKRGDSFDGTIKLIASGTETAPIFFGPYGSGERPIITSLKTIDQWKSLGNGLYESLNSIVVDDEVRIVVFNNNIQEMGRFPNKNDPNGGYLTIETPHGVTGVSSKSLSTAPSFVGAKIVMKLNPYIINSYKVSAQIGEKIEFSGMPADSKYVPQTGYGFFVQGHPRTLDQLGEWYFNPSTKKLVMFFGSKDPSSYSVQVASNKYLLENGKASGIVFRDISFRGANDTSIELAGGSSIIFDNISVEFAGYDGLHSIGVSKLRIVNSTFRNNGNNAIYLRSGNLGAIVRNNLIENTALIPGNIRNGDRNGIAVFAVSDNSLIENNRIINTGFNGIQFNGNNTVVNSNFVKSFCLTKNDCGGIYTFGGSQRVNRKVIRNIVLDAVASKVGEPNINPTRRFLAEGIYLDDNTDGVEVRGNTVANSENSSLKMSNVRSIIVSDNLFYNARRHVLMSNNMIGQDTRNVIIEKNTFFSKNAGQTSYFINTHKDLIDLSLMFNSNHNRFLSPLGDEFLFELSYAISGSKIERLLNRKGLSELISKDINSVFIDPAIESYEIKNLIGSNRIPNGNFDSNISGLSCNVATCSWDAGKIDKGSLKAATPGTITNNVTIHFPLGEMQAGKSYLLKFNSIASKESSHRVYFRHTGSPWSTVSPVRSLLMKTSRSMHEMLISPISSGKLNLVFATDSAALNYWIDNIVLQEVEATVTDPDQIFRLVYNDSLVARNVILNGIYNDVHGGAHNNEITLNPFQSAVLFKISGEATPVTTTPKSGPMAASFINLGSNASVVFNGNEYVRGDQHILGSDSKLSFNEQASIHPFFQRGRFAPELNIEIPVENGTYQVTTFHNETFFGYNGRQASQGQRVFDISIEGKLLKNELDMFVENKNKELTLSFNNIKVIDGTLNIDLLAKVNNAIITGFSFARVDSNPETSYSVSHFLNLTNSPSITYAANIFQNGISSLVSSGSSISTNLTASEHALFQKGRFAKDLSFAIPLDNGFYTVMTYHNETYFGKNGRKESAGQRVFDIRIEGRVVKQGFDMFLENSNRETVLTFRNVEVKDGVLNLDLSATANNAIISGVAILKND
jgi:hypothetical protein